MSQENVELVLKDLEYWNRGDIDVFVFLWDDEVVAPSRRGWPERVFRGKQAVRAFYEGFAETVGRDSVIEDLIDAGEVVVMRMRVHMSGVQSGIEGEIAVLPKVTTFRKRQGRAGRVLLGIHEEALEAARAVGAAPAPRVPTNASKNSMSPGWPRAILRGRCRRRTWTVRGRHRGTSPAAMSRPSSTGWTPRSRGAALAALHGKSTGVTALTRWRLVLESPWWPVARLLGSTVTRSERPGDCPLARSEPSGRESGAAVQS